MRHWSSFFHASAFLAISACTPLTPDYKRPTDATINRPEVQGAFASNIGDTVTTSPPIDQWWLLYRNTELTNLVEKALSVNTDVRVAIANLARANAGLDVARDAQMPQLGLQAAPAYGRNSAEEKLTKGPLSNQRTYSISASVSYQVDLFGQVSRSIESAAARSDAARAAVAATRMTVAAQTAQSFISACTSGRELSVAQRAIDIQSQATRLAERQHSDGRVSSLDVTRSTTQEEQLRAILPGLEARRQEALYRLAVLTGLPPTDFPRNLAHCVQEPSLAAPIPTGDGRTLLARRPDVARAEAELHAATADLGVATADLYPRISLGVSGGSVGLMNNFLSDDTYKFSIGPLISWQFPNRGRAKAQVEGAQASIDAAYARFDGTVLAALQEVEIALNAYRRDIERLAPLMAANQSAAKASNDTRRLYSEGREGFLSVLDADRSLLAIEQNVAAQQTVIASDQIQLFLALGGGWRAP